MTGKLKFYNGVKGYGFITVDGGVDVFFHYTHLLMTSKEQDKLKAMPGAEMVFEPAEGPRGTFAKDVRLKGVEPAA